ncbi:MAG: hypothetical protein ACTHMM_18400 [Agriterribacter sp.]
MTNEEILMDGNEGEHPETVAANLTSSCIYSMLDQARKDEAEKFNYFLKRNDYPYTFPDSDIKKEFEVLYQLFKNQNNNHGRNSKNL